MAFWAIIVPTFGAQVGFEHEGLSCRVRALGCGV